MKKLSKNHRIEILYLMLLIMVFPSCNFGDRATSEVRNFFVMDDIEPPVLLEVQSVNSKQVRLVFNEEITPYSNTFEKYQVENEGYSLLITLDETIKPGHRVMLSGRVKDFGGNTTGVETPVWGFNPNVPEMVINEFSSRGEGNNPDRTELYIKGDGSLAGITLYNGIPESWDSCVIFDDISVKSGDYIVVWWAPEMPEGVKDKDGVINICANSNENLPGYNGVITLSESPAQGSDVIDCVVYSNFSATYEGYGSKSTLERVTRACNNGWWSDIKSPVNSSNNTATRSLCRREDGSWYVCVTKGSSFGYANTSEEYI